MKTKLQSDGTIMPRSSAAIGCAVATFDSKKEKIVIEVGGRTGKHGARTDLNYKITRFQSRKKITESTYISSVGFEEGEHIVHKYN